MAGLSVSLNYPPLLKDGQAYLYAGYLDYGRSNAHVGYRVKQGTVSVTGLQQPAIFHLASKNYTLGGKQAHMNTPPLLIDNQFYVPLEVATQGMTFHIAYIAQKGTVRFTPFSEEVSLLSNRKVSKGGPASLRPGLSLPAPHGPDSLRQV